MHCAMDAVGSVPRRHGLDRSHPAMNPPTCATTKTSAPAGLRDYARDLVPYRERAKAALEALGPPAKQRAPVKDR